MTRTEFLREQTVSGKNKCRRTIVPQMSVANDSRSISERKALVLQKIFENMPIYIGEKELIVGTRTYFAKTNNDIESHGVCDYDIRTKIPYVNEKDIECFGFDQSYRNGTHFTPDFSIILKKGIDGIIKEAEERKKDPSLFQLNIDFLSAVIIAYNGLKNLIIRYSEEAVSMSEKASDEDRENLIEISRICKKISSDPPETFHEAVQLLWFSHLGTIVESFEFINYGRLDVILGKFLKGTKISDAQQIIECLLLKMYDQADLNISYLGKYAAQLVITLGGVLPNGENAVNDVTMMFLNAIDKIRLPEPEFNLRINIKNPPEFLDKAAELTVSGCNFISYYNDDLFIESLNSSGIPIEYARDYGFDLCQDINIPGRGDFWVVGSMSLVPSLMDLLKNDRSFSNFDSLMEKFKSNIAILVKHIVDGFNSSEKTMSLYANGKTDEFFENLKVHKKSVDRASNSPMAPLPLLSALYHGSIENALDVAFEPYPLKEKGFYFGTATEAINSLAAIKYVVYDKKLYTLDEIYYACESNFDLEKGKIIKSILWNCPKWGNDDDYVDGIAKDLLEFCLKECNKYKTFLGGQVLGGIHQPHPVLNGSFLMATPEGRSEKAPVAVTLTPESGTMRNGPTAVLKSASKIDHSLVQWNYCVMINYFSSVFNGNDGKNIFKSLLDGYFKSGGLQHQPNVTNVNDLKKAQLEPEKYKDLIVRLWGVSAHFVDLPKELQDEMIARFS